MNKYIYIELVFIFCIVTMALFLYYDHFENHPLKVKFYWIWIKSKELLWCSAVNVLIPWSRYKLKFVSYMLIFFYILRVIWQVWEIEDYLAANKPYVIDILFGVIILIVVIISIVPEKYFLKLKNKIKWRNSKRFG